MLVPADELTTRLDTAAAGVFSEGASFFLFVCLFVVVSFDQRYLFLSSVGVS